ncbi:hypothetical protein FDP41_006692 [Naegleria fowleri]|uniref:Uncharacterized protein n=1 Tax=Naegleria fowleri TaxID=5763 RepID=A0A6A5BGZ6_NAEFO|nr:uncharacterized protein FDP41_006692 [Naegleria fowleri]KAF0974082.1 hypothetical protein FDP41_006692 [Naegleria fowleri]
MKIKLTTISQRTNIRIKEIVEEIILPCFIRSLQNFLNKAFDEKSTQEKQTIEWDYQLYTDVYSLFMDVTDEQDTRNVEEDNPQPVQSAMDFNQGMSNCFQMRNRLDMSRICWLQD